jgi:hypothetical protein
MPEKLCNNLAINLKNVNYFGNAVLESNIIIYTIIASVIAALGFLNNATPAIIGSMLVSPVLSPLYNILIKYVSNAPFNFVKGVGFHIFLLIICALIGFIAVSINETINMYPKETKEMINRTNYQYIISDVGIASMCGIGIAFAILRGDIITRVGFGIAITVLPAMVNAGMYLGLTYQAYLNDNQNKQKEYLEKCKKTAILTFVNTLVCLLFSFISLSGYCYFVKN